MSGWFICPATNCTEGLTLGEMALGILIAVGVVALIAWIVKRVV